MAEQIRIWYNTEEADMEIHRVTTAGWDVVAIPQPVNWPIVNKYLDSLPGKYLSVSCPMHDAPTHTYFVQKFFFSNKNAGFAFKMRFG